MSPGLGFCDLDFAKVDTDRLRRRGFPEVIYSPGKSQAQLLSIARAILKKKHPLLLTRLDKDAYSCLLKDIPGLQYNSQGKIAYKKFGPVKFKKGYVVVVTAGTIDIPVAEEAAITLNLMSNRVVKIYDCGVAGVHRVLHKMNILKRAKVIIVVAGMEGALASLISGMVSCPVVAVPTSFGYGASFKGLAALLTMLNSCSPGISVVNIDNGFGAGYFAGLINKD